jgi:hypothetical protein
MREEKIVDAAQWPVVQQSLALFSLDILSSFSWFRVAAAIELRSVS